MPEKKKRRNDKHNDPEWKKAKKFMDKYTASMERAQRYGRGVGNRIRKTFRQKREGEWHSDISAMATVFGNALYASASASNFDFGCITLLFEWVAEKFWAMRIEKELPHIRSLYNQIVRGRYTRRRPLVFNDLDNKVWYEPHKTKKILCFDSQGRVKIMIYTGDGFYESLHFRRIWRRAYFAFGKYLKRASLKLHRDKGFGLGYGDCRDIGYLFSYERIHPIAGQGTGKVDRACDHAGDIAYFLFEINSTLTELELLKRLKEKKNAY